MTIESRKSLWIAAGVLALVFLAGGLAGAAIALVSRRPEFPHRFEMERIELPEVPPAPGLPRGTVFYKRLGDEFGAELGLDEEQAGRVDSMMEIQREKADSLLESMGLRERKSIDLIACPSCGRAEVDVIDIAKRAQEAFGDREIPLQVAVMGCVVNGPGEARDADIGIAAGSRRGHLFVRGTNVAVVPEDQMVDALVEWAEFIHEHGIERASMRRIAILTHSQAHERIRSEN